MCVTLDFLCFSVRIVLVKVGIVLHQVLPFLLVVLGACTTMDANLLAVEALESSG